MPETDEQPEDGLDELDQARRINFRDYPSSGLVVIAALSSGLGWMLFKWLGKRRRARNGAPEAKDASSQRENPSRNGS